MNFDSSTNDRFMSVNGLTAVLNLPAALKSLVQGSVEQVHGLPPHHPRRAFLVDEYPACPPHWMRSSGRVKSYFVAVKEDRGLWLDFNDCLHHTTNHAAIVVSIQGVNAITGLPCKDATLEQYRDECPKHKKPFGPDRFCAQCNFKWPKQNYLCSTGTPRGGLWIDGFRAEDGAIRQYVFTANEVRSVAKAILKADRVFAIGISFFLSKEQRPVERVVTRGLCSLSEDTPVGGDSTYFTDNVLYDKSIGTHTYTAGPVTFASSLKFQSGNQGATGPSGPGAEAQITCNAAATLRSAAVPRSMPVKVKSLEIAAGAKISQMIYDDPMNLDYWQNEPEGLIVVNYAPEEDVEKIVAAGKIDVSGSDEGFMQKMPVGNP